MCANTFFFATVFQLRHNIGNGVCCFFSPVRSLHSGLYRYIAEAHLRYLCQFKHERQMEEFGSFYCLPSVSKAESAIFFMRFFPSFFDRGASIFIQALNLENRSHSVWRHGTRKRKRISKKEKKKSRKANVCVTRENKTRARLNQTKINQICDGARVTLNFLYPFFVLSLSVRSFSLGRKSILNRWNCRAGPMRTISTNTNVAENENKKNRRRHHVAVYAWCICSWNFPCLPLLESCSFLSTSSWWRDKENTNCVFQRSEQISLTDETTLDDYFEFYNWISAANISRFQFSNWEKNASSQNERLSDAVEWCDTRLRARSALQT